MLCRRFGMERRDASFLVISSKLPKAPSPLWNSIRRFIKSAEPLYVEPLAELFSFVVRYLTTNGKSTCYACRSPFTLRYRSLS